MAFRKYELLAYVTRLKELCPELPPANTMALSLRSPLTGFGDHRLNFPVPCTDRQSGAPPETCQILEDLPAWNELLSFVNMEAREVTPGRLTISTMCAYSLGVLDSRLEQAQLALLCLHWLLTEHRCVDLVEADRFALNTRPRLMLDALRRSQCLVAVRLSSHSIEADVMADLLAALADTHRLTDLHCSDVRISGDDEQLEAVTAGFKAALGFLQTLQLTRVRGFTNSDAIIQALRSDSNICKLAIDLPHKQPSRDALFQFISGSAVLEELTLVGSDRSAGACTLDYLIEAMAASKTLAKLCVEQYTFDVLEVTLLTNALADSKTIRQVVFNSCIWLQQGHRYDRQRDGPDRVAHCEACKGWWSEGWPVDPFIRAVSRSPALQRLAISSCPFKVDQLRRLLEAVAKNSSFQTLSFQWLMQMSTEELFAMLKSTGTVGKVAVACCRYRPMLTNDWLYMPRESTTNGEHVFFDLNPLRLSQVCATLATNYMITALCLHGSLTRALDDREPADSLAAFVATTTSLKELRVSVRASEQSMCVILSGICRNTSLEKLSIEGWSLSGADVRQFCQWIQQSRHLCHLVLLRGRSKANAALVSGLAECADDIYTLTFFCTWEKGPDRAQLQVVKNMIRRNGSLVRRAAHFALGSSMARCASAFELVHWHPALPSAVQELAAVDGQGARGMLEEARRRLNRDFWRLAGVVREELCCHERADGRLQIDQLGHDCLLLVRRFLRVGDLIGNGGRQTCKAPTSPVSVRVLRKRKSSE